MRCLRYPILLAMLAVVLVSQSRAADEIKPNAPPEPEGMKALFNGKDLTDWDGDPRLWSFKEGVVRGETTKENPAKGNTFIIWKGGTLGDFELRLSFRIKGGNSGIQYRAKQYPTKETDENKWIVGGYQAEVEDTPGKVGFLYDEHGTRGYLCNVGEKVAYDAEGKRQVFGSLGYSKDAIGKTYKKSDWNDYIIIGKGNNLKHYLNGYQTVDITDNDPKKAATSGILALQIHAGDPMVVEFKDVRLKQEAVKK